MSSRFAKFNNIFKDNFISLKAEGGEEKIEEDKAWHQRDIDGGCNAALR